MKRFVSVLFAFVVCFGLTGIALGAPSGNITVTFSVANLSISLSSTAVAFGTLAPGASVVSAYSIDITNDGNADESFQIKSSSVTTSFNLVTSTPASSAEFRLLAVFNTAAPAIGTFDTVNDYLSGFDRLSSAAAFAGDQQGDNVTSATSRNLWLRLDAPTGNPAPGQQTVTVTVTALAP